MTLCCLALSLFFVFSPVNSHAESRKTARALVAKFDAAAPSTKPKYFQLENEGFDKWYTLFEDFYDSQTEARREYNKLLKESKKLYEYGPVKMENGSALLYFFPTEALSGILKNGILNQHQTGHSIQGGANNKKRRAQLEDSIIEIESKYNPSKSNPNHYLRPKSVILDPSGVRPDLKKMVETNGMNDGRQYGDFIAILKDEVKSRTTWSAGDSYAPSHTSSWQAPPIQSMRENLYEVKEPRGYFEAQVWGELDLRDIKEFWIPESTSLQTIERLKTTGLPLYTYTAGEKHIVYSHLKRSKLIYPGDQEKINLLKLENRSNWREFAESTAFYTDISAKNAACAKAAQKIGKFPKRRIKILP